MSTSASAVVACYLLAVVVANLSVAQWGQAALPFTASLLVPFDLVARDVLHARWEGDRLWWRMTLLIGSGSILSALLNAGAARIAAASFVSFLLCGWVNTGLYHLMRAEPRLPRMVVSSSFAAIADSIAFPLLAFPAVAVMLCIYQATFKSLSATVFSYLYLRLRHPEDLEL